MAQCNTKTRLDFHPHLPVDVTFDAPELSTDGGALLIRQVDDALGLCEGLSSLVPDDRDPERVEHTRLEQLRQRIYQIVMGYEDQNDADRLRHDGVFKTACGRCPDEAGLSSQPTLSLLENAVDQKDVDRMRDVLEWRWIGDIPDEAEVVVLDVDASGFEVHGAQQQSFFDGYFDAHVYHPLLIFDGTTGQLITVRLRPGNVGDSTEAEDDLRRIIRRLKTLRGDLDVVVRADAGFAAPRIYRVLEELDALWGGVSYVIGISKNSAFERKLAAHMEQARAIHERTGGKARQFGSFFHQARSWDKQRWVVGKAEVTSQGDNPRFVITDLEGFSERLLYHAYCQRGMCEQWIGEFKGGLKGGRMSCKSFVANAFRCILFQAAYRLMWALRERIRELASRAADEPADATDEAGRADDGCVGLLVRLARAQFDTLRILLLKVAAQLTQSTRRIHLAMPRSYPMGPVYRRLAVALNRPRDG